MILAIYHISRLVNQHFVIYRYPLLIHSEKKTDYFPIYRYDKYISWDVVKIKQKYFPLPFGNLT